MVESIVTWYVRDDKDPERLLPYWGFQNRAQPRGRWHVGPLSGERPPVITPEGGLALAAPPWASLRSRSRSRAALGASASARWSTRSSQATRSRDRMTALALARWRRARACAASTVVRSTTRTRTLQQPQPRHAGHRQAGREGRPGARVGAAHRGTPRAGGSARKAEAGRGTCHDSWAVARAALVSGRATAGSWRCRAKAAAGRQRSSRAWWRPEKSSRSSRAARRTARHDNASAVRVGPRGALSAPISHARRALPHLPR